jgi:hypothetical protein
MLRPFVCCCEEPKLIFKLYPFYIKKQYCNLLEAENGCYTLFMFQNFLIRKMLRTQGVPEAQIAMFIGMMEKNPELFKTIAEEIGEKVKSGMNQTDAGVLIMKKYEQELKKLI